MHKLMVGVSQVREALQHLVAAGFSAQQAKAIILTIKVIHDGPWLEPEEPDDAVK